MTEEEKAVNEAQQQTACQIMSCDNVIRCKENILYGTSVCVWGDGYCNNKTAEHEFTSSYILVVAIY